MTSVVGGVVAAPAAGRCGAAAELRGPSDAVAAGAAAAGVAADPAPVAVLSDPMPVLPSGIENGLSARDRVEELAGATATSGWTLPS